MPARHRLLPLLLALGLTLASCGDPAPTPESDAGKRPADIEAQAASLDVETLQETLANYAATITPLEARVAELQNQLRTLDAGSILGPEGARLSKESEQIRRQLVSLQRSQRAYTAALEAKR